MSNPMGMKLPVHMEYDDGRIVDAQNHLVPGGHIVKAVNYHERLERIARAAVKIQGDNYGNATETHLAMIEWAKQARTILQELEGEL